jgi:hypothetical protein
VTEPDDPATEDWSASEADPADVAEQHTEAGPGDIDPDTAMRELRIADDQPEADVLEQNMDVPEDDDDYPLP